MSDDQITTAAELDALPGDSIILDRSDWLWLKCNDDGGEWQCGGRYNRPFSSVQLIETFGPFAVKYVPEGVAEPRVSANSRSVANDPVAATPARTEPTEEEIKRAAADAIDWRMGWASLHWPEIPQTVRHAFAQAIAPAIAALYASAPTVAEVKAEAAQGTLDRITDAVRDVAYERATHAERGWTSEHDAEHGPWHLISLARDRLWSSEHMSSSNRELRGLWVKAASLLVAAIELIDREEADRG